MDIVTVCRNVNGVSEMVRTRLDEHYVCNDELLAQGRFCDNGKLRLMFYNTPYVRDLAVSYKEYRKKTTEMIKFLVGSGLLCETEIKHWKRVATENNMRIPNVSFDGIKWVCVA